MKVKHMLQSSHMATRASSRRSYDQYCAVARGLDVIGDRWTMLLIRDLLLGPKRYKDLISGMPGIGTNLLADRLRDLDAAGLIERAVLPPPAGSTVYQLTESGEALEPVVISLGRWGARFMGSPKKTDVMVPRAYFIAMRAVYNRQAAAGVKATYEVRIGDLVFEIRVDDSRLVTSEGRTAGNPDAIFSLDVETLNALMFRLIMPAAALGNGRVKIEKGDQQALERLFRIVGFHHGFPSLSGGGQGRGSRASRRG